jgi:uncharacterized iron-regulated protein
MKYIAHLIIIIGLFVYGSQQVAGQELASYRIFDKDGGITDFGQMAEVCSQTEIILFGELHNNSIVHWLQLELTMNLFERKGEQLILGMEMFEADDQLKIDEYFSGLIAERNFRQDARLWNNYTTDIRPLVEFARESQLRLIATNIPRRYAALVNREGFEGLEDLTPEGLKYVAPLPVAYDPDLPGYKAMLEMAGLPAHTSDNFPKAQAIKDATMAHFIFKNYFPDHVFLHFHGAFHSNNYEGIVWYLQRLQPNLRLITISSVEQSQIETLDEENLGLADFIIVSPNTMTKTY